MAYALQGIPLSDNELELVGRLWGSPPLPHRSSTDHAAASQPDLPELHVTRPLTAAVGAVGSSRACAV